MAQDTLPPMERLDDEGATPGPDAASDRRRRSAKQVGVTVAVCLLGWMLLFAPVLERNARTGPLGTRRTVALAVLEPVIRISDAIGATDLAEGALRALGNDPDAQAGGELDLPDFELPPLPPPSVTGPTAPTSPEPTGPSTGATGGPGEEEPPETEVEPIRVPTTDQPLRVAVVGDSLSQGLGASVVQAFDEDLARVLSLGRQSTGLARQDYFNWQRAMREIRDRFRPDLLFVLLGTNDTQPQLSSNGDSIPVGTTEWVAGYRERATAFLREATSGGTHVVWVGLPIVRDRDRWGFYERVNAIYAEVAEADPLATYVDAWTAFDDRDGRYTAFVRNERGVLQEMRASDGLHFTPIGYDYLARLAIRAADEAFRVPDRVVGFRL